MTISIHTIAAESPAVALLGREPQHLVEVFHARARQNGGDVGYLFFNEENFVREPGGEERLIPTERTYAELDRRARAIAVDLVERGAAGERAIIFHPPGEEFLAAFLGCLYAGVIAVPAYPPDPLRIARQLPRLQAVLNSAAARFVLCERRASGWLPRRFFSNPAAIEPAVVFTDEVPLAAAERWRMPDLCPSSLAFLQYTSGSTGEPKGVMITHGNLLANLTQIDQMFDHDGVIAATWLPPYHDMGLIGSQLQCWFSHRPLLILTPTAFFQRPYRWLKLISDYRVWTTGGPNFAYDLCVQKITAEERQTLDLSSWTIAVNGSEPIRPATLERFVDAFAACGARREMFLASYGLAEATLAVTASVRFAGPVVANFDRAALEDKQAVPAADWSTQTARLVSSGSPGPGIDLRIVEPTTQRELDVGGIGEIWIAGPNVAAGYYRDAAATAASFAAYTTRGDGPFLRTGDLGFLRDGELYVTDRLKDIVILRGRNFAPHDLEATIEASHAALRPHAGVAFSIDDGTREELVIVHEVSGRQRVDLADVVAAIRRELALEHQIEASRIVLVKPASVPKTTSGKLCRQACRQRLERNELNIVHDWRAAPIDDEPSGARLATPRAYVPPRDDLERRLAAIWEEVLGVPRVGIHDSFFDLGGASLQATQIISRVAAQFPCELALESLFDQPTVAQLADQLRAALAECDRHAEADRALLARLDDMTDDEAAALLATEFGEPTFAGGASPSHAELPPPRPSPDFAPAPDSPAEDTKPVRTPGDASPPDTPIGPPPPPLPLAPRIPMDGDVIGPTTGGATYHDPAR